MLRVLHETGRKDMLLLVSSEGDQTHYWMSWRDAIQLYFPNILKCLFRCVPIENSAEKCLLCPETIIARFYSNDFWYPWRVHDNAVMQKEYKGSKLLTRELIVSSCMPTHWNDFLTLKVMYSGSSLTVSDGFCHQYRRLHFIICMLGIPLRFHSLLTSIVCEGLGGMTSPE